MKYKKIIKKIELLDIPMGKSGILFMHAKTKNLCLVVHPYQAATSGENQRRLRSFAALGKAGVMHPEGVLE